MFDEVLDKVIEKVNKPNPVAVDSGYKTPTAKYIMDGPKTKDCF
jgi:hypothetical protein